MGQVANQIRVLLQRVRMAGREPHRILLHQGLREALKNEMTTDRKPVSVSRLDSTVPAIYDRRLNASEMTFDDVPILVDNSVGEILVQVKPREYADHEPSKVVDWKNVLKHKRAFA